MRLLEGTIFDRPPHCERCGKPESECDCPAPAVLHKPPGKQTARIAMEKRAKGKRVTVVRGLAAEDNDLPALLKQLKNTLGSGGTLTEEGLELQGELLDRVRTALQAMGFKVKG